jgi:ankyrin repeat protein
VEVAKILLTNKADVDHEDSEGTPLLQLAVDTGSKEMVKLLLEYKADVKARDKYGLTAYVYALKKGEPEIVKLIKDAGGKY